MSDAHDRSVENHGWKRMNAGDHEMSFRVVWQESEQWGCPSQGLPHSTQGGARGSVSAHRVRLLENLQAMC